MLYFIYGTDRDKAREKESALIEGLRKKKPEAELFRLEADMWSDPLNSVRGEAQLDELIGGQGLFERKFIVFLNRLFENAEAKEAVIARLGALGESENIFIMLEDKVDKPTLLAISEHAEQVQEFEKKTDKKAEFNIFSLTDALGKRDRKNLWVLYQKALASGAVPEEIHGILFWQVKCMLLAGGAASAKEAGLSPFPFMKAKQFVRNYSREELTALSGKLVALYHDAHRGIHDFPIALERFVLTI